MVDPGAVEAVSVLTDERRAPHLNRSWARSVPGKAAVVPRTTSAPKPKVKVLATKIVRTTKVNWDAIAKCESGGHWNHHAATAGLYWGGLQMDLTFWHSYHGDRDFAPRPDLATKAEQIVVAERAYRTRGLTPWPTCGRLG